MNHSLINLVDLAGTVYTLMLIANALMSWVQPDPHNPIVRILNAATEPVLRPIRSVLPTMGGMDFSPVVAILGVQLLENVLVRMLI